jgi:hypothetical protein
MAGSNETAAASQQQLASCGKQVIGSLLRADFRITLNSYDCNGYKAHSMTLQATAACYAVPWFAYSANRCCCRWRSPVRLMLTGLQNDRDNSLTDEIPSFA